VISKILQRHTEKCNPFWDYFIQWDKKNKSHCHSYCKACVAHLESTTHTLVDADTFPSDIDAVPLLAAIMAKFIAEAQAEEAREEEHSLDPDFDSDEDEPTPLHLQTTSRCPCKWQKQTLATLFSANTKKKIVLKLSGQALQEEAMYMEVEAAADADKDAIPDDEH
jgi:hypothetical protein